MIAAPTMTPSARTGSVRTGRPTILGLLAIVETWIERRRQRRALLELNDHMLRDIGISRYDAYHESSKPFWRA